MSDHPIVNMYLMNDMLDPKPELAQSGLDREADISTSGAPSHAFVLFAADGWGESAT
jgi:hypothetical protein